MELMTWTQKKMLRDVAVDVENDLYYWVARYLWYNFYASTKSPKCDFLLIFLTLTRLLSTESRN